MIRTRQYSISYQILATILVFYRLLIIASIIQCAVSSEGSSQEVNIMNPSLNLDDPSTKVAVVDDTSR